MAQGGGCVGEHPWIAAERFQAGVADGIVVPYGQALVMSRKWKAALAPFLAGIPVQEVVYSEVIVHDFTLGNGKTIYFTNGIGRTIYTFSLDSFNINKFTKADLSNNNDFPIYEQTQMVVPSVLDKTLFGNIEFAGKQQLTYKGWPLHFFGQDSVRGLTLAVSVPVAGKWPVAVKDIADPKR